MSMIDVSGKVEVYREAVAEGVIRLKPETIDLIERGLVEKGDVYTVTRVAAINAVKKTPEILPLCHNIPIMHVEVGFERINHDRLKITVKVKAKAQTGVEMEALTGVAAALLNVFDMVKKYEKDEKGLYPDTFIENIRVVSKTKG